MNDTQKIEQLRKLLGAVVNNTKRAMIGKDANSSTEHKHTSKILNALLGREATPQELALASTY